jgi:hypothetical protein
LQQPTLHNALAEAWVWLPATLLFLLSNPQGTFLFLQGATQLLPNHNPLGKYALPHYHLA